jgi:hypothetical protein
VSEFVHPCIELPLEQGLFDSFIDFFLGKSKATHWPQGHIALDRKWKRGSEITISFHGGPFDLHARVLEVAKEWELVCDIRFGVAKNGRGMIRVGFDPTVGPQSVVGTDANKIAKSKTTMNLGELLSHTDLARFRGLVLHEFGHAIGFRHEHQHGEARIDWNEDAVLAYYLQFPDWNEAKVRKHIFEKYDTDQKNSTEYDRNSIMHYPIPIEHIKSGEPVGWNYELSDLDRQLAARVYGPSRLI